MSRSRLSNKVEDLGSWPTAVITGLTEKQQEQFEARQKALRLYFEGVPIIQIQAVTGVSQFSLSRFAKKCTSLAQDGQIWGFRALLPYIRITQTTYQRNAEERPKRLEQQGGQSGLLSALLNKFPDLEERLKKEILQKGKRTEVAPAKLRPKDLYQIFIEFLRANGANRDEWPFTAKHRGKRSICTYMRRILDQHFAVSVGNWEDTAAKAHVNVGTGKNTFLFFDEPFDAVEIDAYHVDCHAVVAFATPDGGETLVRIQRLWLLAAIDRRSTAVLAHTIVYRSEVAADDVLRLIRSAVTEKWAPIPITIGGYQYGAGSGLPSGLFESCFGAIWSVTMLDGALAHLANAVRERARKALGFVINWGPVGHFERRPNVERTFKEIAKDVFHRLPSTTGSNPHNGRAENAEEKAVELRIVADDIKPLVDIYFAHHNATPTEGQFNRTPLEVLAHYLEGPNAMSAPRKLPTAQFEAAKTLACRETATIRGGRKTGRRPYIQIDRVRYTSALLANSGELVGTMLTVDIDEEDMRQVKVYLPNGQELGFLTAHGKWSITKHSRRTRRAINSLLAKRDLVLSEFDDPVLAYLGRLSTPKSGKRRQGESVLTAKQATDAARIAHEANAPLKIAARKTAASQRTVSRALSTLSLIESPVDFNRKIRNRS
jgi:putative transposase